MTPGLIADAHGSGLPGLIEAARQSTHTQPPLVVQALAAIGLTIGFPVIVLAVTFLVARFATRRLRTTLTATGFQLNIAILLARATWVGVWAIGLLLILNFLGVGLTPLAAFVGVVGLAASLSLQQVLQNLVAGVYLLAERPFAIGDIVSVVGQAGLNHEGTVEDIQMRTTHLRGRDNELILVPNSAIFSGVVTNRTAVGGYASQMRLTFPREIQPESVRERVVQVLESLPAVLSQPPPDLRVDRAAKDSWTASVLFWTTTRAAEAAAIYAVAQALPDASVNESGLPV